MPIGEDGDPQVGLDNDFTPKDIQKKFFHPVTWKCILKQRVQKSHDTVLMRQPTKTTPYSQTIGDPIYCSSAKKSIST